MGKLWRGIKSTIFWAHERGSWPYDVMVVAIVLFVLASPRSWFHDQPFSTDVSNADIEIVSEDAGARTRTFRLDAQILPPDKRTPRATPELERETHDILGRAVEDLKGQTFQVRRIDPVRSNEGSVLYYDVTVQK
jgi:hypothetical protein